MPVTEPNFDQLSKQNPQLASLIYQKAEREIKGNFEKQISILQKKSRILEEEVELLRSKERFDRD